MLLGQFDIKNPNRSSFIHRYNAFFELTEQFYELSNLVLEKNLNFLRKNRNLNEHSVE